MRMRTLGKIILRGSEGARGPMPLCQLMVEEEESQLVIESVGLQCTGRWCGQCDGACGMSSEMGS